MSTFRTALATVGVIAIFGVAGAVGWWAHSGPTGVTTADVSTKIQTDVPSMIDAKITAANLATKSYVDDKVAYGDAKYVTQADFDNDVRPLTTKVAGLADAAQAVADKVAGLQDAANAAAGKLDKIPDDVGAQLASLNGKVDANAGRI